jgi:hypothetical protein
MAKQPGFAICHLPFAICHLRPFAICHFQDAFFGILLASPHADSLCRLHKCMMLRRNDTIVSTPASTDEQADQRTGRTRDDTTLMSRDRLR